MTVTDDPTIRPSGGQPVAVRGTPRTKAPEPQFSTNPITGERYWSREFFEREWSSLWPRVWQVAGRVEQIPEPGDYVTYEIGRDSIIAVRGDDMAVRCFYNVCQHRGNRLVTAEVGTLATGEFQCAYHGWRFAADGECTWAYDADDFLPEFQGGDPCGNRNLVELPSDTWAGFIWFNMDPDAAPLREWLDPVADHLDVYRMEDMRRTHWVTVVGDWNWKCVQDNFNESYHLPFVHPQTLASMNEHHSGCQFDLYPSGHARMLMPGGGPGPQYDGKPDRTLKSLGPDLEFWEVDPEPYLDDLPSLRLALQRAKREKGADKGYDFSGYSDEQLTDNYHYTVFPNISFSMKPDGCIWLRGTPHPTDPEKCIFDMWYLTAFPEGVSEYWSNSMREWVSIDHQVEHQVGSADEVSCGPGIDQDVAIWKTQQQGLRSRGFRGEYLPWQERRIKYFHDNVDRYLAMGPLGVNGEEFDLGDVADLAEGEMRCFADVDTDGVLLCRVGGELYAVQDNCSHADQKLSEGRFRRGMITCPKHGASFDVRDGSHQSPPAFTGLVTYDVIGDETGVSVRRRAADSGETGPAAPRFR